MGTITEKMSYLKETKQAIRTAIEEKGVSVADTDTFRSYASKIGTISVGGGGTKWYVGDFYNGQMYEGNNGDLFLNTGTTDQGTIFQFYDGMWSPVGNLMGPQGAQGLSGASEPVGSIVLWGGDSVPANYLPCVGSAVSRTEYSDLFSVIGTQFGEGDGSTTFNLPDFSGLAPVGIDSSDINFNTVGKTYGEKTHTLTEGEMPSHNHKLNNGTKTPNGDGIDFGSTSGIAHMTYEEGEYYWSDTTYIGGSQAHNNIQPSIAMKFYIKAYQATATPAQVVDSLEGNSTTDAPSVHAVNQKLQELTGGDDSWKDITLNSEFVVYEGGTSPKCRKKNGLVEIVGQIAPSANLPGSSTAVVIGTLPYGYAPNSTRYYICQGSGTNKWLFTVYANGNFGFSRYGVTQSIECTTENWLPFNVVYTIEDETTNILPKNYERSIVQFHMKTDSFAVNADQEYVIPLYGAYWIGTGITQDEDGYIRVGDSVQNVMISAMVDVAVATDGDYSGRIDIDGDNNWLMATGRNAGTIKAGRPFHLSIGPYILDTGMIKRFNMKINITGGNGTIQHDGNGRCILYVEVVKRSEE